VLDTLSYNITFPTGRSFDRTLRFQEGMTAIIGPNEQGKSLTLEMIRFCLFGTGALRGSADDYKHLQASLTFSVKGQRYGVIRGSKTCVLSHDGGEAIARGTKPVNAELLAILGFDLDVFDVACAANQGDVERLANMKPTARREMVDRLIGADRIDEIVDWAAAEGLALKREIDVLQRGVHDVPEPVKPEGYRPLAELSMEIQAAQDYRDATVKLQAWLDNAPPAPEPVGEPPHAFTHAVLDQAEAKLSLVPYDFDIAKTRARWAAFEAWRERATFLRHNPRPSEGLTLEVVQDQLKRIELSTELKRLEQVYDRLQTGPKTECPACGHGFLLGHKETEQARLDVEAQRIALDSYAAVKGIYDWSDELRRLTNWAKIGDLPPVAEVNEPSISMNEVKLAETNGIPAKELRDWLMANGLAGMSRQMIRSFRRDLDAYEARKTAAGPAQERRAAWELQAPVMREALAKARERASGLDVLRGLAVQVSAYDQRLERYQTDLKAQETLKAELDLKALERQSWLMGKEQLNALRLKLKSYLAPSLSAAASSLLAQMTRGARRSIWVDENFEITVDGQKLQTLSGSGKVCANLALRIGLAQVLTNNVLSIFIGDEMDAFMDPERVSALNESLERLTIRVGQIIVITHKPPVCKQVIDLGKFA
jgi:DNA repair exonuclease SbcCD ATPase subunit